MGVPVGTGQHRHQWCDASLGRALLLRAAPSRASLGRGAELAGGVGHPP